MIGSGFERTPDRRRDAGPLLHLLAELLTPRFGQRVELRAAIVFGCVPLCGEPSRFLEPMKGGKQRPRLDDEGAAGDLLDASGHTKSVELAGRQGLENEKVERALQKRSGLAWQG